MFKYKKGLIISLLTGITLLSSLAEANTLNAPGPYIGVTGIDKTSARVNFLDNSDNENGFLLFDDSGDINVTVPKNNETAPSQTYVTLTGLTCDRVYTIKALAFNSNGNSETSDARSFNINTTFGIDCGGDDDEDNSSPVPPALDPTTIPSTIFD